MYWVYIILWEAFCWGMGFYLILEQGWSHWWLLGSFYLSCCNLPKRGARTPQTEPGDNTSDPD